MARKHLLFLLLFLTLMLQRKAFPQKALRAKYQDESGAPHLLEVNHNPSFAVPTPLGAQTFPALH